MGGMLCLLVLTLASCAGQLDTIDTWVEHRGSVYDCKTADDAVLELCTLLDQEQLEAQTGYDCWHSVRLGPFPLGCAYSCDPGHVGCNAHNGCFCPGGA